jgi:hypothetical protein
MLTVVRLKRSSLVLALAALIAGCGGKQSSDTTPAAASETEPAQASSDMIPPETMEEIERRLDRKRRIVSHCLASAVDAKELPKNAAGKITIEIVISPAGKAETVKVVRATLESQMLTDCVIDRVKEIQFPELPRPFPTSYTYGFEAM